MSAKTQTWHHISFWHCLFWLLPNLSTHFCSHQNLPNANLHATMSVKKHLGTNFWLQFICFFQQWSCQMTTRKALMMRRMTQVAKMRGGNGQVETHHEQFWHFGFHCASNWLVVWHEQCSRILIWGLVFTMKPFHHCWSANAIWQLSDSAHEKQIVTVVCDLHWESHVGWRFVAELVWQSVTRRAHTAVLMPQKQDPTGASTLVA